MARISTEGRVFANQYFREAKRLEALHAGAISPGTTAWADAFPALFDRLKAEGSPLKRATMIKRVSKYLLSVKNDQKFYAFFDCWMRSSRSATLWLLTFTTDLHPFENVNEEGLHIRQYLLHCIRNGSIGLVNGIDLAYVSRHALSRLRERCYDIEHRDATTMFGFAGVLGFLARDSKKHIKGELCLRFQNLLIVGSLKHPRKSLTSGKEVNGTFYDVRTVLPADEVSNQAMLEQGKIATAVVVEWWKKRQREFDDTLIEQVPFLPRREDDYTMRSITTPEKSFV